MQVQQDQIRLGFLQPCQGRQHVLYRDVDGFLKNQGSVKFFHNPAQMLRAALPVSCRLVQQRWAFGAEFLNRVSGLRYFHNAVTGKKRNTQGMPISVIFAVPETVRRERPHFLRWATWRASECRASTR